MNSRLLFVLASFGLMTPALAAQDSGGEFWYQVKGGQHAVTLDANGNNYKVELSQSGSKVADVSATTSAFGLNYMYGIDNNNAFGFRTDFGSQTTTTTPTGGSASDSKDSGMGDLHFYYNGFSDMSGMALNYGVEASYGLSKHKEGSTGKDGDRSSGGMSLEPYIGLHAPGMLGGAIGAKLSYLYNMERTYVDQSTTPETEYKVTGGSFVALTPYYELNHGAGYVDVYLRYATVGDSTKKLSSGDTTSGSMNALGLGVKGTYDVSANATLFADLQYNMISNYNASSTYEKASFKILAWTVGGRLTF